MARAKFDAKEFFLNYGDRVGIGIAGFLALLLLVFAMLGSSGGVSADQVKDSTQKADSAIKRSQPDAEVVALKGEPGVKTLDEIEKLSRSLAHLFSIDVLKLGYPFYEYEPRRGKFRSNPEALRPVEIAAIPLVGAFKVYETKVDGQGLWVMVLKPKNAANAPKVPGTTNRPGVGPGGIPGGIGAPPPPPSGTTGGGGGLGIGSGGGNQSGMDAPGAGGRGGRGRPDPRGRGAPGKPAAQPPPASGNPGAVEDAYDVQWKQLKDVRPEDTYLGIGIRPIRNALIVASYPHAKQVDEIARKLQIEKGDVTNWYRGLDVQRRVVVPKGQLLPDGTPAPADMAFVADPKDPNKTLYRPLEEVDNLVAERERLNDPNEDISKRDALAGWVKVDMRRVVETMWSAYMVARTSKEGFYTEKEPIIEQLVGYAGRRVAMPLPKMPRNEYPLLYERLPQLQAAVKKIKDDATARIPPPPKDPRITRGAGNIGDDPFGVLADERRDEKPKDAPPGPTKPGGDNAADVSGSIPDLVLVRFIDVDLDPEVVGGMTYEYRIRIVLDNPNWKQEQDVAAPDFAKIETIAGAWSPAARVSFQPDTLIYADDRQKSRSGEERDKVPVQIHQWLGKVENTNRETVTVGDWWIERMNVSRGEFIGKSPDLPGGALNLIQWISYAYDSVNQLIGGDVQKRTVTPASLTRSLLVDFQGGSQQTFPGVNNRGSRREDVPAEILTVEPDGRLTAHALTQDREDEDRRARFTHWEEWGKKLTTAKPNTPAGAGGANKGGNPGQ